jgi:site-specific recombinase XerD
MSNVSFYQSEIEEKFQSFLTTKSLSNKTIVNYRSDVKHFIDWINANYLTANNSVINATTFFAFITPEIISAYQKTQTENTPASTINRRLSSVRLLFAWATETGLITVNPTLTIRNADIPISPTSQTIEGLLGAFERSLKQDGASESTIKNYVSDVQQFLNWTIQQPQTPAT